MRNPYRKKQQEPEFWVTNISKMNVSLGDLNLTIKAYSTVNLLDTRHYHYTIEQLKKSAESGSLYKKRDKIFLRESAPETNAQRIPYVEEAIIPPRDRSVFQIEQQEYEELNLSDEEFAEENAEMADIDSQPLIVKKN